MPSSARIHTMGYESDQEEGDNPDRQDEEEEIPFEGQEYDGDADIELTDNGYDEHIGTGAIIASVHIACESSDEKISITQVTQLATTGKSKSNQKITNELVSSIKEQSQGQKVYISQVIGKTYVDYSSIYNPGYMGNIC